MESGFKRGTYDRTYGDGDSLINLLLVHWDVMLRTFSVGLFHSQLLLLIQAALFRARVSFYLFFGFS